MKSFAEDNEDMLQGILGKKKISISGNGRSKYKEQKIYFLVD